MKNQNTPSINIIQGPINIVESDFLNKAAEHFRTTDFCSKFVSEEGFSLNEIFGFWEWRIRFNNKDGWMVIYQDRQRKNTFHLFAYEYEDQILMIPTLSFRVDNVSRLSKVVIPQVVKNLYHEKIQNYGR